MQVYRPLDLVQFRSSKPTQSLWEEFFGPYPWFFAPLIGDLLSENGKSVSRVFSENRRIISEFVPNRWKSEHEWGQWNVISQVQFRAALSQDLVRLDKACLTIAMVYASDPKRNFYNKMSKYMNIIQHEHAIILPSTFVLDGISRILRDNVNLEFLMDITGQRRILFEEISRGYAVVEYIAQEIVDNCKLIEESHVEIRLLKDRRDGIQRKTVKPVASQIMYADKIKSFYNINT